MNSKPQEQATPPAWAPGEGASPAAQKAAQDLIDKSEAWLCSLKLEQGDGSFAGEAGAVLEGLELVAQAMRGWHIQAGKDIGDFASKLETLRDVIRRSSSQDEIARTCYNAIESVDRLQKALAGYETAMGRENM